MSLPKHNDQSSSGNKLWIFLTIAGIFLLLAVSVVSFQVSRSNLLDRAGQTISAAKSTCHKYDDYRLNIVTKDLQTLINKTNMLKTYGSTEDLTDEEFLRSYADNQYLSGIFILNSQLQKIAGVDIDEKNNALLLSFLLSDQQAREILSYPQKVYANHMELSQQTYDYAMVSAKDGNGVVICYTNTSRFQKDHYELSLTNLLTSDYEKNDAILVITDGSNVLSSLNTDLEGQSVKDCPVTNVVDHDLARNDQSFLKLSYKGLTWYGKQEQYRTYYLYAFYPSKNVLYSMCQAIVITFVLYVVFCLVLALIIQYQKKERLARLSKEYHLVNAIASIYSINLLIHLDTNTWEPILQTERLARTITGIHDADRMLSTFCEKLIMPSSREEFRKFSDPFTAHERLHGRPFLGYTFEADTGVWWQSLLVPQTRDSSDEVTSLMLLLRNVSEQKLREMNYQESLRIAAEKADFANASKTDFLRRMSHDIRTPINGIRGMARIGIDNLNNPDRVMDCFRKILTSSDFLLELVNNVLDMSKLEAGKVEFDHEAFDLRDVLKNAQNIVATQALESGITFVCNTPSGEHWHLTGSPLNVQRVLQNIMANAVKYNRRGGLVRCTCKETASDEHTATFVFVCADTGIGMSKEFQAHAFEAFTQADKSARTTYSGSGLGLAIAKKTVELLGGSISFVSEEGKGTTFTITLPLTIDTSWQEKAPEVMEECSIQGARVLMAEDNDLNREIASYMLAERGAVVTEAENGQKAVELFAASKPGDFDIILMDIMMPVMNGLEAAKAIRAMNRPDAASIPIIAVTANAFSDDIAASRASGMDAHLSKPLDFTQLSALIAHYRNAPENT